MDFSTKMKQSKKSGAYYISACIFVLLVLGIALSLYYSVLKIDYVWRWYRIPQYFLFQDQVDIRAQLKGEVESIPVRYYRNPGVAKATREVITTSLQPFELWFVCAVLYLVLTFSLSMFLQYLEQRTQVT
jgi:uncharacterized membrane protein (DUF373 family)